jgi:hypothetical protein
MPASTLSPSPTNPTHTQANQLTTYQQKTEEQNRDIPISKRLQRRHQMHMQAFLCPNYLTNIRNRLNSRPEGSSGPQYPAPRLGMARRSGTNYLPKTSTRGRPCDSFELRRTPAF